MGKLFLITAITICPFIGFSQIYTPGGVIQGSSSGTSNQIGIGTANPSAKLDISPGSMLGGLLIKTTTAPSLGGGYSTTPYALQVKKYDMSLEPISTNTFFTIDGSGRTRIGSQVQSIGSADNLAVGSSMGVYESSSKYIRLGYGLPGDPFGGSFHGISWKESSGSELFQIGSEGKLPILNLSPSGAVGINTTDIQSGAYSLYVNGKMISEESVVKLKADWPDYVFSENYDLLTIDDLRIYISKNGKLPYLPSAEEVSSNGASLGENQTHLVRLVEELTLRLLDMDERVQELEAQLSKQKAQHHGEKGDSAE